MREKKKKSESEEEEGEDETINQYIEKIIDSSQWIMFAKGDDEKRGKEKPH